MEHIEIGNTGDLVDDVDLRFENKCIRCDYNKQKGTICSLTTKWCYISIKTCMLIGEVRLKDEFKGPESGLYKVFKKNDERYFMHKKSEELLNYNQETLNLLTKVVKKKKKSEVK